ncbi:hypothetical protein, partial [Flagellimonas crocea]|uniref:hypothetical protein n=1 Tax=Flagellimonas crocea TaxID=3067311 RepID=UPI00296E9EF5
MINFDNIYLVIFYLIFGLPGAIVRFSAFNLFTIFGIGGFNVDTPKIRAVSLIIKFTEYDTKKIHP